MTRWNHTVRQIGHLIETRFDQLRYTLKRRLRYDQPLQLIPYAGYGNQQTLYLQGRVLEHKGKIDRLDEESLWDNLVDTYQRFDSDEVPGVQVNISVLGVQVSTQTDEEGYYRVTLPTPAGLETNTLWYPVTLTLPPQAALKALPEPVTGAVMVPPAHCDFGIISDIDDTIMVTDANNLLTMARLTFLHSPATRQAFAGVAAFYRALSEGGLTARPVFYVSSSPWNLYDFLVEFMALHDIPPGSLLLRDFGLNSEQWVQSSHYQHKLTRIQQIMDTYPQLSFILLGDSGQQDPEVYADIVATRPQQVRAVYIRDVSPDARRDAEVLRLAEQTRQHNVELILMADTLVAATHAVAQGYIHASELPHIQAAIVRDSAPANQVETVVAQPDSSHHPIEK